MKNKYEFAFKRSDGLWVLEESAKVTKLEWDKFTVSMTSMISALKDFKVLEKGCIFDK